MNHSRRGDVTESKVVAKLMELGLSVATTVGDSDRYDVVVDDGELHRVQIKTGRFDEGNVIFNCTSNTRVSGEKVETTYTDDEIDAFAIYSPDMDEYYWVDISNATNSEMWLRVKDAKSNHPSINWAGEYEITERFK